MTWHIMSAQAKKAHLWVHRTGPGAPEFGRWVTPSGRDVNRVLGSTGPKDVDVEWWFEQSAENPGTELVDVLWQSGLGLKVYSRRLCSLLSELGADLRTFEIDVRLSTGERVADYLGALEPTTPPAGPVHSLLAGRRTDQVVVSDDVRAALTDSSVSGVQWESVGEAFPGDHGYFV